MARFLERLDEACQSSESLVCVGLDPDPKRMPAMGVADFNAAIVEATAGLACAYKPNLAFYEALGIPGLTALEQTVTCIRSQAPHAIVIGDAKRGDMGPSSEAYAAAMFRVWDFDAVTINGWGGSDSIEPFLDDPDHGAFLWCRGSNPGSADLQDLEVAGPHGNIPLYQHLALTAGHWNSGGKSVRNSCPDMPFLIPGVGAQGGDLEAAVGDGVDSNGRRAIVNSSRGIIYASTGSDFAAAAARETARLRDAINRILDSRDQGWR